MIITRKDPITGKTNTMDLDVTTQQIELWNKGALLQNAFPHLNADEREFIKTGIMPDTWDGMFEVDGKGEDFDPSDFDCPICGKEGGH